MGTYNLNGFEYYAGLADTEAASSTTSFAGTGNVFLCEAALKGLIERYSLSGKTVFSMGSGTAFEEYWLYRSGCHLTLNDLDESGTIMRHLQTIPSVVDSSPNLLRFEIGDAAAVLEKYPDSAFDVLYVSSFHPDEIRRELIQQEFEKTRSIDETARYITWPSDKKPYSDVMIQGLTKVSAGGLIIFQHYRGGVYPDTNPHYLSAVQTQLAESGAVLLEVYAFRKSPPHILLVAYRGCVEKALRFTDELNSKRPLLTFHGRYPDEFIKTDIV